MSEPFWTDARIDELKALVAEGLSYAAIGTTMGVSKNTAQSKANRLGLAASHPNAFGPTKKPATIFARLDALHATLDQVLAETRPWVEDRKPAMVRAA